MRHEGPQYTGTSFGQPPKICDEVIVIMQRKVYALNLQNFKHGLPQEAGLAKNGLPKGSFSVIERKTDVKT